MKFVGHLTKFNGNIKFDFVLHDNDIKNAAERIKTEFNLKQINTPIIHKLGPNDMAQIYELKESTYILRVLTCRCDYTPRSAIYLKKK